MSVRYRLLHPSEIDEGLTDAWRAIQSGNEAFASPYFCPDFTRLVAGVRDDVQVVAIENSGRPVGFFPFQRAPFGMGRPVGGALSDYHGVVAESGSEWSVTDLLRAAKLSAWSFDHLVDTSGRFQPHVTAQATSPLIDLGAGFENYMRELGTPPSDFPRKARKLAKDRGALTFTFHDADDRLLERMIEWKRDQYSRTQVPDAFGVRWTGDLLRAIMARQTAEFSGVCSVLRAGDDVIAVHVGMRSRQVLHWWFPTYDRSVEKYSPGIILLFRIAEALVTTGATVIDLGKGDAQYKRSAMNRTVELQEGCVEMSSSLLVMALRMERAVEARVAKGGAIAPLLNLPLRMLRRIERAKRFR
jgi:CelD/BcsL family acetyltransferase involved in cellulose biosynthesis